MNVEIVGKFFDNHSLSIINRYIALELAKLCNLTITPIDKPDPSNKLNKSQLKELMSLSNKDIGEIDVQLRHSYPPMWRWPINDKTKIVIMQGWEFTKTPSEWQYKFESFADHVVTYSNWTKNIYLDGGLNPNRLSVISPGYNPEIFNSENRVRNRKFTFTFVGCPQFRKGLDILISAFSKSFTKSDSVQLLIKDTPQIYGENSLISEILKLQYVSDVAEITLMDDSLSEEEMALIYKQTDVLVHPFRGEGFGMHIQEAMACGAFPLITGGGAPDDFVDESCGLRINSSRKLINLTSERVFATKPGDSLSNMGSHAWVIEPDETDLVNKMRFLYHHHERDTVLNTVKNATRLNTWENSAKKFAELFTSLYKSDSPVIRR